MWESGAILIYLAEKTGQFLPKEEPARSATIQWLMWQMCVPRSGRCAGCRVGTGAEPALTPRPRDRGGLGPMLGQFGHFFKFAPERVEYGIARYAKEGKRLLGVLDAQLAKHPFVAGDEYTIADMAIYPWLAAVPRFYGEEAYDKLGFNEFEHVKAYMERIKERPPVQRGIEAMAFPKSS